MGWFLRSPSRKAGVVGLPDQSPGFLQSLPATWAGCGDRWELAQGPVAASVWARASEDSAWALQGNHQCLSLCMGSCSSVDFFQCVSVLCPYTGHSLSFPVSGQVMHFTRCMCSSDLMQKKNNNKNCNDVGVGTEPPTWHAFAPLIC